KKLSRTSLKTLQQVRPVESSDVDYSSFDQLDGRHPWMDEVPEGYVPYNVRVLPDGKVAYFNFDLAKDMGLIAQDHPNQLTPALRKKIIETFSIRIINEYDQEQGVQFPKSKIKPYPHMATRYLQLQHQNKQGKTSGDGRCIWNGVFKGKNRIWDVSSRGIGVTRLAPGAVEAGKPLQSGSTDFGYGCGMAEIDELYGASIMAEIFHRQGLITERMLTVIDLGDGLGIGVRAAPNLIRPAHLFLFLKQKDRAALRRAVDYLIVRQHRNREWKFGIHQKNKYRLMLREVCSAFAKFVARLDRHYIFAWLDWDGDNVLANGGIIDYGSVRQFGIRHDQYRYDDVERFSTNLNQQIPKARLMMQAFAQIVHYLETGKRLPLERFHRHPAIRRFDHQVQKNLRQEFLHQLGFPEKEIENLMKRYGRDVEKLYLNFTALERVKTRKEAQKVADGVNRPAVLNMRTLVRNLIQFYHDHMEDMETAEYPTSELFKSMLSEYAGRKDSKLTPALRRRLDTLKHDYLHLITISIRRSGKGKKALLDQLYQRATVLNREDRITGNALIHIVGEIMESKKAGFSNSEIQQVMDEFIINQSIRPDQASSATEPQIPGRNRHLIESFLTLVDGHKEDI
ncbi:MAG: YdiU family protein, partial [Bdellovibrionales bacterium]|nr:YdiU family protein [Bdellovibrionales bacterium]